MLDGLKDHATRSGSDRCIISRHKKKKNRRALLSACPPVCEREIESDDAPRSARAPCLRAYRAYCSRYVLCIVALYGSCTLHLCGAYSRSVLFTKMRSLLLLFAALAGAGRYEGLDVAHMRRAEEQRVEKDLGHVHVVVAGQSPELWLCPGLFLQL